MTQSVPGNGSGARPRQDLIGAPYVRNAWYVAAWSDDRDGNGVAQPEPELFLETYWRQ